MAVEQELRMWRVFDDLAVALQRAVSARDLHRVECLSFRVRHGVTCLELARAEHAGDQVEAERLAELCALFAKKFVQLERSAA